MQDIINYLGINIDYTRELLIVALILGRTMPMIFLTPWFAGQLAPPEVKMGLGFILTSLLWPLARESVSGAVPHDAIGFTALMLKEVFIGFTVGFLNSHIFWVMEMAGRMIDTVRGTSMSEVMSPHSKKRATPIGDLYFQLLLVFFVLFGGHHIFLSTYFYSFALLPLNEMLPSLVTSDQFFDFVYKTTSAVLLLATLLAAPAVAATFITDIVFGILNRVAPQLNAYFMSMPVKAMAGVAMVLVALDAFVTRAEYYIVWGLNAVSAALSHLAAGGV